MKFKLLILLLFALLGMSFVYGLHALYQEKPIPSETKQKLSSHFQWGAVGAKHHVVLFCDFESSACKQWHTDMFPLINNQIKHEFARFSFVYTGSFDLEAKALLWMQKNHRLESLSFFNQLYDQRLDSEVSINRLIQSNSKSDMDINALHQDGYFNELMKSDQTLIRLLDVKHTPVLYIDGNRVKQPFSEQEIKNIVEQ